MVSNTGLSHFWQPMLRRIMSATALAYDCKSDGLQKRLTCADLIC
jgi:hypothetical protein